MGIFRSKIYKYLLTALVVILLLVVGLVAYINSFSSNFIIQPVSKSTDRSGNSGIAIITPTLIPVRTINPVQSKPSVITAEIIREDSTNPNQEVNPSGSSIIPFTPGASNSPVSLKTSLSVTPTPKMEQTKHLSSPSPNPNQPAKSPPTLTFQPINRKLTTEEREILTKVERDLASLKASLNRLDEIRTDTHPDEPVWRGKLDNEISLWQSILAYYYSTPMPGRVGTQVMPIWLAVLARLDRAGQTMPSAYQQAEGKGVSQADQEVAYAEIEMIQLGKLIISLKQL